MCHVGTLYLYHSVVSAQHIGYIPIDAPIWCMGVLFINHTPLSGPVAGPAGGGPTDRKLVKMPSIRVNPNI